MISASRATPNSMARLPFLVLVLAAAIGLFLAWSVIPVYAHGESVQAAPLEARPGDPVTVTGDEFPPGEEVEVLLEGARGNVPLSHAEADDSGAFSITVAIPEDVSPGSYQLVAATEDDNISLDFTVLEGASEPRAEGGTTLVFQRSTSEVIAIGIITAALILGGVFLVAGGRRYHA